MMIRSLILGTGLALSLASGSFAQDSLLDGSNVDEILGLAQGYGDAALEEQSNGDPKIKGEMDGVTYAVYFMNCDKKHANCEDINFYAGFLDLKPKADVINSWNRDKRFGKAYLDADGDAVVEMDLNLEHGVSADNLDAAFGVWQMIMTQYTDYVGYQKK